jgi:DNA helicase-2/ATP-dependent DNA helicase PcrA
MDFSPTEQQVKVINHLNGHARVLAIAGSGKTTTMVYRIKNLIENHNVDPKSIRVMMFNRSASEDFKRKTQNVLKSKDLPYISTFHSFAFQFIEQIIKDGNLNKFVYWIDEHEYEAEKLLTKIIKELEKKEIIEKNKVDLEKIKTSISLWKGSLITPENAGHKYSNDYVTVYKEFEIKRNELNALTYDDFIPLTVAILLNNNYYFEKWSNKTEHLIVDEYQDVNFGQQSLIEILAGKRANIMVVGDDDQTIYEWRGARPEYILKEFETTFTSKPHSIYKLDRTFRFGPLLAQYAHNSISLNSTRHTKNVLANDIKKGTDIEIIHSNTKNVFNTNDELTKIISKLVIEEKVKPKEIRVIARLYSQFNNLETSFIINKVPYKVEGNIPFFKRREVKILIEYSLLFENLYSPINKIIVALLLNIINSPNRKINKSRLESFIKKRNSGVLIDILHDYSIENNDFQPLLNFIIDGEVYLNQQVENNTYKTSALIEWIFENSKLQSHYLNYYGEGEEAINKISTSMSFISFCANLEMKPNELYKHIENLDTTMGLEKDDLILFSTVHKTKGLEFDYVIIPDFIEGNMPYISENQITVFNKLNPEFVTKLSDSLESERRLFYVAITRAIKKVYLGTTDSDKVKASRFLEEILYSITRNALYPIVSGNILKQKWLEQIKNVLGYKKIIDNIKLYLNSSGEINLRQEVDNLAINIPEQEFSYKNAYDSKRKIIEATGINKPNPWDNVNIK